MWAFDGVWKPTARETSNGPLRKGTLVTFKSVPSEEQLGLIHIRDCHA